MQVIIDTSNEDIFLSLVDENKTIAFKHIKDLKQKADNLPLLFKELTKYIAPKYIDSFYITIGPGSFTGARVGLVFARSIAQITGANLFTTTSLQLIAGPSGSCKAYADARSNKSYFALVEEGQISKGITLVDFIKGDKANYKDIIKNPSSYFKIFKLEKDLLKIHPAYIKAPAIGGK